MCPDPAGDSRVDQRHHGRCDGSGYPRGLSGETIPLAARIFSIVDVWDALSSDRPYRGAWPREKVRQHLAQEAGAHFEPGVVEAFLRLEASLAAEGADEIAPTTGAHLGTNGR